MSDSFRFRSTKRSGDFENKKLLVLREAARLFAEKGAQQTSLDEIAESLGISKPALYYYFKSKDEMISDCLARGHKNDEENVARIFEHFESGADRLRELCHYYVNTITEDFGRCIVLIDLNSLSDDGKKRFLKSQRFLYSQIRKIIQGGCADGSLKPCNETITTFALIGALNSAARWYKPGGRLTPGDIAEQIYRVYADGIVVEGGGG